MRFLSFVKLERFKAAFLEDTKARRELLAHPLVPHPLVLRLVEVATARL